MNNIKQECEDLTKIGLQMTGLITTVSVSGLTSEKIQMLTALNDDISKKTNTIVSEATKISQSLENSQVKISGLRKDLQASNKKFYDAQQSQRMLQLELDETKDELNTSIKTVDDFFADDMFPEEEPSASTQQGKHPLNASKKATIKKSAKKQPTKGKESREKRRESENKESRPKRREVENRETAEPVPKKVKVVETVASGPSGEEEDDQDKEPTKGKESRERRRKSDNKESRPKRREVENRETTEPVPKKVKAVETAASGPSGEEEDNQDK